MISTPFTLDVVRGTASLEATPRGIAPHRLPVWVRRQFPDPQLLAAEAQPSGVRLAFSTTSSRIELLTHPARVAYRGAERSRGRIDVVVDGILHTRDELTGGDRLEVDLQTGATSAYSGTAHTTTVTGLGADLKRIRVPWNAAAFLRDVPSSGQRTCSVSLTPISA